MTDADMRWSASPPPRPPQPPRHLPPPTSIPKSRPSTSTSNSNNYNDSSRAEREISETPVDIFSAGFAQNGSGGGGGGGPHSPSELPNADSDPLAAQARISMYVRIVDEMLSTVLSSETYLFTPRELLVLTKFKDLDYEAKYLLTRLLLRKTNRIFGLRELVRRYSGEIGERNMEGCVERLVEVWDVSGVEGMGVKDEGPAEGAGGGIGEKNGAATASPSNDSQKAPKPPDQQPSPPLQPEPAPPPPLTTSPLPNPDPITNLTTPLPPPPPSRKPSAESEIIEISSGSEDDSPSKSTLNNRPTRAASQSEREMKVSASKKKASPVKAIAGGKKPGKVYSIFKTPKKSPNTTGAGKKGTSSTLTGSGKKKPGSMNMSLALGSDEDEELQMVLRLSQDEAAKEKEKRGRSLMTPPRVMGREVIEIPSSPAGPGPIPGPVASGSNVKLPAVTPVLASTKGKGTGKGKRRTSEDSKSTASSNDTANPKKAGINLTGSEYIPTLGLGLDGKPTTPTEEVLAAFYSLRSPETENISSFARGISSLSAEEMISQLGVAELTPIAKELKLWKSKMNRGDIIAVLLGEANKQSRLNFTPMGMGTGRARPGLEERNTAPGTGVGQGQGTQSVLPFTPASSTRSASFSTPTTGGTAGKGTSWLTGKNLLRTKIAEVYGGKAIQISTQFRHLIHRLNLVFYRSLISASTDGPKSLMLPEILNSSSRRSYPSIDYARTQIWPNREALLKYETALQMEAMVDEALGEQNHSSGNWVGPSGFGFGQGIRGGRIEGAKRARRVWEGVRDEWRRAVREAQEGGGEGVGARHVLDRFTLGHILTRVVSKGAIALGVLHEYDLECEVWRELLAQRVWRRGKRGAWYDRLALVLMNHYGGSVEKKEEAVEACQDGLEDPDVHLIYRPRLSRRLKRLEKQLELLKEERHICEAVLEIPEERTLRAERVKVTQDKSGQIRPFFAVRRSVSVMDEEEEGEGGGSAAAAATAADYGRGAKSMWLGREGPVGVEAWCLEWWDQQGWKGYHAEGSILTTLFTLLMWPILFQPLPGAFETPYQLAPLDLGDDNFYTARQSAIEDRLKLMSKSSKNMLGMLKEVDDRERGRNTVAIGLSWRFEREDLKEVAECLGGKAVAGICRLFCQGYGYRAGGVPDLIVWNYPEKRCRFSEVKSPNDTLSETQKIWISVLQSLNVEVEVCHVAECLPGDKSSLRLPKRKATDQGDGVGGGFGGRKVKKPKVYDWELGSEDGGVGGADVDEEDEGGEEYEEWRMEEGDEARVKGRGGEGRMLTREEAGELRVMEEAENRGPLPKFINKKPLKRKAAVVNGDEDEDIDMEWIPSDAENDIDSNDNNKNKTYNDQADFRHRQVSGRKKVRKLAPEIKAIKSAGERGRGLRKSLSLEMRE